MYLDRSFKIYRPEKIINGSIELDAQWYLKYYWKIRYSSEFEELYTRKNFQEKVIID